MSVPPPSDAAWRRTNLGHLLFAATGVCIARKLHVVRHDGFEVSDAQLVVFQYLDDKGTRLTTLAVRAGITKQSMIELVDKAERQGLIARLPEPLDGRAKIVGLTSRGRKLRDAVERGSAEAERAFAAAIGEANVAAIRRALPASVPDSGGVDSVESLLGNAGRCFVRDVLSNVHRHGYRNVTEALLTLFRTLELDGSRLTTVASAGRITKQSMRLLVERAETLSLVERATDPADGRAKIIRFTEAGLVMMDDLRRGVVETEAAFARAKGDAFFHELKAWLGAFLSISQAR